ncbi:MAG TPA: HAMP domain-containing protein [Chromatiales bacterium]|nr:HAMP domain-containing protein [Thiotrichales bacterium]HIP68908.1 HAMP domain-containing protein [Chromatiales bacterium]
MHLALRLNLLIFILFLLALVAGFYFTISNARHAVSQETSASAELTMQLLSTATISLQMSGNTEAHKTFLRNLQALDDIRHMNIALFHSDGSITQPFIKTTSDAAPRAPEWFSKLVAPAPKEYRRRLFNPSYGKTDITIIPNPADEISEAWTDARLTLILLAAFTVLSMGLIYFIIHRALKPVGNILAALNIVERGDLKTRLPELHLPELNRIAAQFNTMAETLERQQNENRRLSKHSLKIQENERRHMARELHDELGQSISAIKALAVSMEQQGSREKCQSTETATSIINVCNHIYDVVRNMMNRLRPAVLDELGLVTALERLIDDWNTHHPDSFCKLIIAGTFEGQEEQLNITIYRIIQEALTNVSKHANANTVTVTLKKPAPSEGANTDMITLKIEDDGQGFKPEDKQSGMGLMGMRERVLSIDGKMSLESSTGKGVCIVIELPVLKMQTVSE